MSSHDSDPGVERFSARRTPRLVRFAAILVGVLLLPVVSGYPADVPIATIPVGDAPVSVAVNPVSHRVYVANYYGSSVSVIDGVSDTVSSTVSLGDFTVPIAVVANPIAVPARAYVANFWTNTVTVIDESSGAATATVPSNGVHAAGPRALALDPSGSDPRLYVANYGSALVTVLDAIDYHEIAAIATGANPRALGIFSSLQRTRVYVANGGSNTVSVIDGATAEVTATIAVGVSPKAVAVDTSSGFAYVTNEGDGTVSVIDDTDALAATVRVGSRPVGIAVDESLGRVFVANYNDGTVSVLRTSDLSHEATLTVGTRPWAIAFDAGDGKAYVTDYGSNSTSVIDSGLGVVNVPCGTNPYAVAVDEMASPHKAYVGNWNSDSVTVIDEPAAPVDLSALSVPEAFASTDSVVVSIDPAITVDGDTASATGSASSIRSLYPAAVSAVFYRTDPAGAWRRATITEGYGTSTVEWRADLGPSSQASYELEVAAFDQTGAAASVSDGGTSVRASSAGGFASATVQTVSQELHPTTTSLALIAPRPSRGAATLVAHVTCAEAGCPGPTGTVAFDALVDDAWTTVGTAPVVDGSATWLLGKHAQGVYRARYSGDEVHESSTSAEVTQERVSLGRQLVR